MYNILLSQQKEGFGMDCLKCGRQTQEKNVFCNDCIADMARFPVKQDTPVYLPQRKQRDRRSPQKKVPKPEEIISQLNKKIRNLWITVATLAVLLTVCAGIITVMLYQQQNKLEMGFNYSTFSSTESTQDNSN